MKEIRRCLESEGGKSILAKQQPLSRKLVDDKVGLLYGGARGGGAGSHRVGTNSLEV